MMTEKNVFVPIKTLVDFMNEALVAMGAPAEDARIIADVMITADLWGVRSHGIAHLRMYNNRLKAGLNLPVTKWTLVKDTPTTAVMDAGNGMGFVAGHEAMTLAIKKAREFGMGSVAVRNSSHFGAAGYYSNMAAKQGLVGLTFTNAHPSSAPTFGVKPMLGTNPIAVGIPSDEKYPYIFDAATSVAPRGKIEVAARADKPIPEGWVIKEDGSYDTNSAGMIKRMNDGEAALLPIGGMGDTQGGHKGYGLATIVEIFSAAFQDGAFLWDLTDTDQDGNPQFLRIGHFFMAIDVEHFIPLPVFKKITGDILRELRNSPTAPDQSRIYTAGEKEFETTQRAEKYGIELSPGVQKSLRTLCQELDLPEDQLGF
jgi:LDH2 family malate/lactate/ureidoglycolate dehydrogenase